MIDSVFCVSFCTFVLVNFRPEVICIEIFCTSKASKLSTSKASKLSTWRPQAGCEPPPSSDLQNNLRLNEIFQYLQLDILVPATYKLCTLLYTCKLCTLRFSIPIKLYAHPSSIPISYAHPCMHAYVCSCKLYVTIRRAPSPYLYKDFCPSTPTTRHMHLLSLPTLSLPHRLHQPGTNVACKNSSASGVSICDFVLVKLVK